MKGRRARLVLGVLAAVLLWAGMALAYDAGLISQAERTAADLRNEISRIEVEIQLPTITDPQLSENRSRLEDLRSTALAKSLELDQPIADLKQQIALLGPVPEKGDDEAPAVADKRRQLNTELNRFLGAKSQLDLAAITAEQLAGRTSSLQRSLFLRRVFEAGRTVLNPGLWADTATGFAMMGSRIAALRATWWNEVKDTADFRVLALMPLVMAGLAGLYFVLRQRLLRWAGAYSSIVSRTPDQISRMWRIVRGVVAAVAALFILVFSTYVALSAGGFVTHRMQIVTNEAINILFTTAVYAVLARRIAAPGEPQWRIVDLDDAAAVRLPILVTLAALVSSVTTGLANIADKLFLPIAYTIGQSALSAMLLLVLLTLILLTVRNQKGLPARTPDRPLYFGWAAIFVPALWLLIGIGTASLLAGYIALASYVSQQVFETGILVAVLFLLHHLADAAVSASFDPQSAFGRALRRATGLGERGIERLGLLFRIVVDVLLLLAGIPLLLALWTFTWVDARGLINTVLFGFKIGDVTLSPWSVLVVMAVFAAGIAATNLIVRWLDWRVLSETNVDKGVQDSLRKGASYGGYIAAGLLAVTAGGLDFTNFAFLAGALGLGLGFGLQSIVSNFVSGLILLAERPVRVGDWVVLAAGEGIVRRINVRATEIETFDSCVIIVPNSSLITEAVKNWTHGDEMGRFAVAVTVAHTSDATRVRDLLLELARAHPKVLTYPEPQVALSRFGVQGLDFEIKAHVASIFDGAAVASDLRFAILESFAENGITIPPPPGLIPQ